MVLEYLPTLGLFKITLGVNVGKYSIHGSLGYDPINSHHFLDSYCHKLG